MPTKKPAPKKAAKPTAKVVTKKAVAAKKAAPVKKAPEKKAPAPVKKSAAKAKPEVKSAVKKPVAAPKAAKAPKVKKSASKVTAPKSAPNGTEKAPATNLQKHKPINKTAAKKAEVYKEVKVPKTSVKTSVPYQPEYKSMDQRVETVRSTEPLIRYTDTELSEFRDLINKKYDAAKKELNYLQGLITRKDDMGGDESENRYMTMEDGSISMEREQLSQMASRQITYIDHLEKALIRIENKTYGICRVTGRLIDKARLRAVPHATLSLEAKMGIVRSGNE